MQYMADILGTILGTKVDDGNLRKERRKRKDTLISLLTPTDSGGGRIFVVKRSQDIDSAIDALAELSPISMAEDLAKKLQKTWSLIWTTEKEINFFIEQGWSTDITQQILDDDTTLINNIPFVNDNGSFGVRGMIYRQEEDPAIRTQFVFESATLRWKWLPQIQFPPVGQGWFDTVYLDDDFRVDRNSRNDILVCRAIEER
jgi:PAP_fibrillin